ncbi:MAG: SDR family oxidoreductase [Treponemataceae bacterium]|nr:SDR family oxidoreductase [Treponemataceae bacterium]
MPKLERGQWALVTGASSGIGECFAYELASKGLNVILLGRDETALKRVATNIEKKQAVELEIVRCDLIQELGKAISILQEFDIDLLVNNAGVGVYGKFLEREPSRYREMIELNITVLTELAFQAGRQMVGKGHGGIINIGSVAGFFPVANFAVYAATKAYVYSFSLSLWAEWKKHHVHVLYVAPGPTRSRFFERSRNGLKRSENSPQVMNPEIVARESLSAYERDKIVYIPGWKNRIGPFLVRRFFSDWMVAQFTEKYYR